MMLLSVSSSSQIHFVVMQCGRVCVGGNVCSFDHV